MRDRAKTLDRILRVRTLQVTLAQGNEARANERVASEEALRGRIGQLVDSVSPETKTADAFSFIAAAHFRERLHRTAEAAEARLKAAENVRDQAGKATQEARRDQNAVEKLIDRERAAAALRALREMENAPPVRKNRHDLC